MKFPKNPNDLDWDTLSKREWKLAELFYEEQTEDTSSHEIYEVWIDGKMWKDFGYKGNQAIRAAQTLRGRGVQAFAKVRRY